MSFELFILRTGLAIATILLAAGAFAVINALSPTSRKVADTGTRTPIDTVDNKKCA